jgi:AcrR family transcriptional regulator
MGRQQALKHQRLLEQAERLFRGKGFKAVAVEEIAAAAGISKMTIYNQFGSKEKLFTEINLLLIKRFNREVEAAVWQETNTFDRLRVYFEKGQETADHYSPAYFKDIYEMPYVIQTITKYKKETTLQILMDILDEGSQKGEIRNEDQHFLVQLLDVLTAGIMQIMPSVGEDDMMAFNRRLFEFIQQGLIAGTKGGSPNEQTGS